MIIGQVWPEPETTAAGKRMLQLITLFSDFGYAVYFGSAAKKSEFSVSLQNVTVKNFDLTLNDSGFDTFITELKPDMVLYDRFVTEEQFGWRISENFPKTLTILNTEDLHCLRKIRQLAFADNTKFEVGSLLNQDITKREIASIYRCDFTLMISDFEIDLLKSLFHIDPSLLFHLPLFVEPISFEDKKNWIAFEDRKDFITIGNGKHAPNVDSILYAIREIWPTIRQELPHANYKIYGAYLPQKINQLHHPKNGILVEGWAQDETEVFQKAKVCLTPIRFGAGIKGKLLASMYNGTPSVTTTIGAEGMLSEDSDWNGFISDNPRKLAKAAIRLYKDKNLWQQCQQNGIELVHTKFNKNKYQIPLRKKLNTITKNLSEHRKNNFIGAMLQLHTAQSTKYLSKWIEEKNKK